MFGEVESEAKGRKPEKFQNIGLQKNLRVEPPIAWNQRREVEILEKINIGIQSEVETLEF